MGIAVAGIGFVLVLLEKDVPLRKKLETDYGIEDGVKTGAERGTSEAEKGQVKPDGAMSGVES